ncbi:MAG: hypothetical protein OEU84_04395 [Xanthomonadales bacterium]|nr:hypothetical protein [Xanthomonadales bacterium]
MKSFKHQVLSVLLVTFGAAAFTTTVQGADALGICNPGQPYLWPGGGVNIPFNPDQGDLNTPTIDNPTGVALVQVAFDNWTAAGPFSVPTTATYTNAGNLPVDVDVNNYGPWLNPVAPDGLSAIVFDADGQIFDQLFGPGSGILGFASPEWVNTITCEILEGVSFLNGPAFTDLVAAEDVMTHEFGHYSNLGHVELNGQLFPFPEGGDTSGPTPDDPFIFNGTLSGELESMYPFYFGAGSGTNSPNADDRASIATLYPAPGFFASTGSISGTVYAPDGVTRLSGVNVIARNIANPMLDAVSTFSGAYTDGTGQADPNVGVYTLNNLTPGAEYVVFVDVITAAAGRFSNPVLSPLPGPEEYWNEDEANSNPPDDVLDATPVVPVAGVPVTGVDIIFNQPAPGDPLPVGDDGFYQLSLPFTYSICAQDFNSVFVNANGNLTFGAGSSDFSESSAEMLSGPPRIAGLWDDLNPSAGGIVTYAQTDSSFTVIYEDIPEFFVTGSNSFSITLSRTNNHIDVEYGSLTALDGLAGVSCGGLITSGTEVESDLTALQDYADLDGGRINLHNSPAVFEEFIDLDNDLLDEILLFNGTTDYNDEWLGKSDKARQISLPFSSDSIQKYTEIEPVGADIDWFRFKVPADKTLLIEIVSGQLDSLIGLVAPDGTQYIDDDGGAGLLSALQIPGTMQGTYYLAVTTFPDFGFTGAGGSGGRYVLEIELIDGISLSLGDDDTIEVPLGFSFPFQGATYDSVWVNSNGNLTFGSGNTDFSNSITDFLSDQPRIAPLWDDLSPNQGGQISVELNAGSATVIFDNVPQFLAGDNNTFMATMRDNGTYTIEYGNIDATDGLAGTTEGGGAADPGATDLSVSGPFNKTGTTYEQFIGDNDLTGITLEFDQ